MKTFIDFLYKYVVLILCFVAIIIYLIYSSEVLKTNESETIIVNISLSLLNLFATIFIATRISMWGWQNENLKNQKKVAKTSIRHIRGYLTQILKIQRIILSKIEDKDSLDKRDLEELYNHIDILYSGIHSSEIDFQELVSEELIEQNQAEIEVMKILTELSGTKKELKSLKENETDNQENIEKLLKKVKSLEHDLEIEKSKFNFSNPYLDSSRDFFKSSELGIGSYRSLYSGNTFKLGVNPDEEKDFENS